MKSFNFSEFLSCGEGNSTINFDPFSALAAGLLIVPFVEINIRELSYHIKLMGLCDEIMVAENMHVSHGIPMNVDSKNKFSDIFQSIGFEEYIRIIESGDYLSGIILGDRNILVSIGSDEAWFISREFIFSELPPGLRRLYSISKSNVDILGKSEIFEIFFRNIDGIG